MDIRTNASTGFLVVLLSLAVANSAVPQSQGRGFVYVTTQADSCTQTKLQLQLDNLTPKPASVLLRITREDKTEVANKELNLGSDGNYYWTGLLVPLGKYKAEVFDARNKSRPLGKPFAFNNIEILRDFIREERGEIIYISRGGGEKETAQDEKLQTKTVDGLPPRANGNQLHIIVMNSRGNKADEYYGPPPVERRWTSKPLKPGEYRLIIAEYKSDQNCQVTRGKVG
ncbi:MAG TPA: hypothetical protein VFI24_10105 [Pyrinomonadaceae bacterium]|nr:hypothetical protein [Pyrinomonadaceae bacterium]